MSLFNKKDKYDIIPDVNELTTACTCYSGRRGVININSKLVVPNGYFFLIGKNGKVLDKFDEGEHFFNYSNLPYVCRKYKFDRIKDGKRKEKFKCQYYFINKSLLPGQFKTYRKVVMGTKAYGIFKLHVYGMFTYKIVNVNEFMQSLLNEFDYIKTGEAEDIISSWVSELAVSVLEKNNFVINDVLNNNPIICEKLKKEVCVLFKKIGAEIVDFEIYKYKLPKELQKTSDEQIKNQKESIQDVKECEALVYANKDFENDSHNVREDNEIIRDTYLTENVYENLNNKEFKKDFFEKVEKIQKRDFEYKPFGSFIIEEGCSKNNNLSENKHNFNREYYDGIKQNLDEENIKKEEIKEYNFIDLENIYKNNAKNIKRCYNCGAENDLDAKKCILCGNTQFKGEI